MKSPIGSIVTGCNVDSVYRAPYIALWARPGGRFPFYLGTETPLGKRITARHQKFVWRVHAGYRNNRQKGLRDAE